MAVIFFVLLLFFVMLSFYDCQAVRAHTHIPKIVCSVQDKTWKKYVKLIMRWNSTHVARGIRNVAIQMFSFICFYENESNNMWR